MRRTLDRHLKEMKSLLNNVRLVYYYTKQSLIFLYWFILKTALKGSCYFNITNEGTQTQNWCRSKIAHLENGQSWRWNRAGAC